MRRLAVPAALAALLAACSVGVEGAPCQTDANCPEGQACEYGGRCSTAAAACGTICRSDACGAGGAQACVPDAGRVCASLAAPVACGGATSCALLGGIAQCVAPAIAAPASGAAVGPAGVAVDAKVTFTAPPSSPPATVELRAGGAPAATLSLTSVSGTRASYGGTYLPATGLETDVGLTVAVGSPVTAESQPVTVRVDTLAPRISGVTATCPQAPCLRDDVLTVNATAADANPGTASASLDLDGFSLSAPMTAGTAQPALGAWPFPAFERNVVVRVTATDAMGNVATSDVTVAGVTRWRQPIGVGTAAATSPAIDAGGMAVFGTATTTAQLHGIQPDGTVAWSTTLEVTPGMGMAVKAAPSIGAVDLFVGAEDGRVYRVLPTGAIPASTPRWPSSTSFTTYPAASLFTPALVMPPGVDHAYAAGAGSSLYQFYSDETVGSLALGAPAQAAGAISGGNPIFVTSTGAAATLRRFTDTAGAPAPLDAVPLSDGGTPGVACDRVSVPLAVDGAGSVIAACDDGQLHRVATGASLADQLLYQLPAGVKPSGSPVVANNGDVLLPADDGNVWKITPSGAAGLGAWPASVAAAAGEVPTGVVAMNPVAAVGGADFLVTTSQGRVVALDLVGAVRWSGQLPGSPGALGFPTVAPVPPGGSASALPTLVAGSAGGKLVRVVVDGSLDAAAPWPKAHHDLRNTGNHGGPLP